MALTKYEQETTVTMNREEGVVRIFTANPSHIRKFKADDRFTAVTTIRDIEPPHAVESISGFIHVDDYSPLTGFKRRRKPMTEDEKQVLRDRFANALEKK